MIYLKVSAVATTARMSQLPGKLVLESRPILSDTELSIKLEIISANHFMEMS